MGFFTKAVNAATISNQTFTSYGTFNNVAFGNGVFLATSSDTSSSYVYNSTDGISWAVISNNAPKFASLVFSNGTFVAIDGSTAKVYTSTDGITWTSNTIVFIPQRLKVVNGNFFIWRSDYINNTNPPAYNVKLLTSSNGISWTDTSIRSTSTRVSGMCSITDIAFGNGKYVVSSSSATFYTSTNLSTRTTVETIDQLGSYYNWSWSSINNVSFFNGKFFSFVSSGDLWTSTNGATWTIDTSWKSNSIMSGLVVNGKYILLGDFGRIYNSSSAPTGFSGWTTSNTKTAMWLNNIVYGNGKYVVVGDYGITVSADLTNWYFVNPNLKSIAYDGTSNYVAVANTYGGYGSFGSIYKTSDWSTWNDVTSSQIPAGINAVTYGNGKFIAVTD